MYIPNHFQTQELIPPAVWQARGEKALTLIDERVLVTLDQLRQAFGPLTVNDWLWGGSYTESGLRTPDCKAYSPYSQHTFGRAMDCKFKGLSAEAVRQSVINNRGDFPYITFLEDDVSWLHFDVRNCEPIVLWSPQTASSRIV